MANWQFIFLLLTSIVTASTLKPPVLPLIVRNPYLSTWLANARDKPWESWPMFYTRSSLGFSVLASVPESTTVFPLLGRAWDALEKDSHHYNLTFPKYLGAQYDASTTNLSYEIAHPSHSGDSAKVILSFLSPITPTSTLRQALPAGYLNVIVEGNFDISIYVDLNGQWVSGDRKSHITWDFKGGDDVEGQLKTFSFQREHQLLFSEIGDQAEWGTLHFTGPKDARHGLGTSALVRRLFAKKGKLANKVDNKFRSIMDEEPVFAYSKLFNLSSSHNDTKSATSSRLKHETALFTIALTQNPITQFAAARGLTYMRPLWMSFFPTEPELIEYHYKDYHNAFVLAANYSAQVAKDAFESGSDNYKDIVELSARQVMGATSFSGTPDNPLLFLKEISSNGNSQTVDVIFPAFPFFLYTNPRWLAYLLEPHLEHQLSGQYPNKYAMHDLGTHFPNLTGYPDGNDEYMPVEECGDMVIMALSLVHSLRHGAQRLPGSIWSNLGRSKPAAALKSDDISAFALPPPDEMETRNGISQLDDGWGGVAADGQARKWLTRAYPLWKQWTAYLEEFGLEPHNQVCTDDFAGPLKLQSNLALKAIIGIKAMGELSEFLGETKDSKYYRDLSESFLAKWKDFAIERDGGRIKLAYDWHGSWTTVYSLFADAILCFHPSVANESSIPLLAASGQQAPLIPDGKSGSSDKNFISDDIYKMQSRWYETAMHKYGLPLDSRHTYTKSDWEFQVAAVSSKKTRKLILDAVALWLNETATDRPFSDLYVTIDDGGFPEGATFFARPVVGSHFAFLALDRACDGKASANFKYEV